MAGIEHGAAADTVKIGDLDRRARVIDRIVGIAPTTVGADVEMSNWRASQSRAVLGYSDGFIQSPCSRQRMCIFVSAKLKATAAPEAPAPMIKTSTGAVMRRGPA